MSPTEIALHPALQALCNAISACMQYVATGENSCATHASFHALSSDTAPYAWDNSIAVCLLGWNSVNRLLNLTHCTHHETVRPRL